MTAVRVPSALLVGVGDTQAVKPAKAAKVAKPLSAAASAAATSPAAVVAAAPALSEAAMAGRVQFNDRCSHCHGTDGYSPVRERDVRYLKLRYGDKWQETAMTTIKNGRPDNGMPIWGQILKESDVQQIVSFFGSIQK